MKKSLLFLIAAAALPLSGPGGAAETQPAQVLRVLPSMKAPHPAFKADARLALPVRVAQADITFDALLKELQEKSGVPLKAEGDTGWMMSTVAVNERPLGDLLSLISTHFGLTWRRAGSGYILWKDRAAIQREKLLQQEDDLALIEQALQIGRLAMLPRAEREALNEKLRQSLQQSGLTSEMRAQLMKQSNMLGKAKHDPLPYQVLLQAPRAALERLLTDRELTFSSRMGEIPERFLKDFIETSKQQPAEELCPPIEVNEVILTYRFDPNDSDAARSSMLAVETEIRPSGHGGGDYLYVDEPAHHYIVRDPRLRRPLVPPSARFRYPSGFRDGPMGPSWTHMTNRWPEGCPTLGEFLLAIHDDCKLDLISDSFLDYRTTSDFDRQRLKTWEELLVRQGERRQVAARIDGNLLRLRAPRFYRLQDRHPPLHLIQEETRRMQPDAESLLRTLVRLTERLTRKQQQGVVRHWGYVWNNDRIFVPSENLRFDMPRTLNLFSKGIREQLLSGRSIPVSALSPADRNVMEKELTRRLVQQRRSTLPAPPVEGPPAIMKLVPYQSEHLIFETNDNQGKRRLIAVTKKFGTEQQNLERLKQYSPPEYRLLPYTRIDITYSLEIQNAAGRRLTSLTTAFLVSPALLPTSATEPGPPQGAVTAETGRP